MTEPDISAIWLTAKTRMISERRLRRSALLSHLALTWFSFCLICESIRLALYPGGQISLLLSLALSILVFALSLIFYGFRFEERAEHFRSCYLRLQKLNRNESSNQQKLNEYHRILEFFPNHSDADYDAMLVESWRHGITPTNSKGQISISKTTIAKIYVKQFVIFVIMIAALTIPVIAFVLQ